MQSPVVDPLLEIDAHGAERRQGPPPIVARVDVLGADDGRLAGDLVHGVAPCSWPVILMCPAQSGPQDGRAL